MNNKLNIKLNLLPILLFSVLLLNGCGEKKGSSDISQDHASRSEENEISIKLNQDTASCDSEKVDISGTTITISEGGTYLFSGTLEHGMVIVDANKENEIEIILNNASIQCDDCAPVYVRQAGHVTLTLAEGSENTLTASGEFTSIDDNNIDGAIFSKSDLTLSGTGALRIQSNYGHGVVSKDNLEVAGGAYTIETARHGLSGKDSILISNGELAITAEKDGLKSEGALSVLDGTIRIEKSDEGMEGKTITVQGGEISIQAEDDGLNASDGSGAQNEFPGNSENAEAYKDLYIRISGGKIDIDAKGDGIDSNGNLYVEGGEVYVSGAENGGDSALDYTGEASITGGMVAAAGFGNMAQNFGEASSQGTMLVQFEAQAAGTEVSLTDAKGSVLLSYAPAKQYDSVVFSHPEITAGNTYTVQCKDVNKEVVMNSLVYGTGQGTPGGFRNPGTGQDGQTPPELPQGQTLPDGQTPPELPEGQTLPDGQTPPDMKNKSGEEAPDTQNIPSDPAMPNTQNSQEESL